MFVVTIFQNPTGICYSEEKCKQLIQLARKHDLLLIVDDVYNVLCYQSKSGDEFRSAPQRLFAYDDPSDPGYKGNVVANGSFAKIVAPGLRLGWFEVPKTIYGRLSSNYAVQSGGGMSSTLSFLLAEAIRFGDVKNHVQELRVIYRKRMNTMIKIIEDELSQLGVTASHPNGGYFVWIKLPEHIKATLVLNHASENYNVTFVPGPNTSLSSQLENYIRLCFAYYEIADMIEGTKRLTKSIATVINDYKK